MKRVLIVGISGAGKTTFAHQLSDSLKISLHHLDKIYWQDDWVPMDKLKWHKVQENLVKNDEWVIDGNYGNYGSTFNLRFPSADTIFVFDFHPVKAFLGALHRTIKYWRKSDLI